MVGVFTGSGLGSGDEKGQRPERFSPAPTPLCHVLPASWSLLLHPGEQAVPGAQHTPQLLSPFEDLSLHTPIPGPEPPRDPRPFSHPIYHPQLGSASTPPITKPEPLLQPIPPGLPPWTPFFMTLPPCTLVPHPSVAPPPWSPTLRRGSQSSLGPLSTYVLPHTPRAALPPPATPPSFSISSLLLAGSLWSLLLPHTNSPKQCP